MRVHISNDPAGILLGRRTAIVVSFLLSWVVAAAVAVAADTFAESPLAIVTPDARHEFTVEVARSREQRARGLMYRSELAMDHGMLFDFGREQEVGMWMRNTLLPLDMLFIDRTGVIRKIEANAKPLSLDTVSSDEPVLAVLELNAGTSRLLGIEPGDQVVHPIFGTGTGSP